MNKSVKNIFTLGAIAPSFISDSISKHSSKKEIGAHSIFLGQIRSDIVENKIVSAVDYTAYEDLALEKMHEIREELFSKYELTCMHVHHSLGTIAVGEICLFVFTSSAHRKAAMEACDELVERIKSELPIWGKEVFEDQTHQWKVNK